jgi:hypothetical protein
LAEYWDLPDTGIFYSKDVASDYGKIRSYGNSQLLIFFLCFAFPEKS